MADRRDLDALTADYLYVQMFARVRAAEKAEAAYQRREAEITTRHRRKNPLDPNAAHINAAVQQVDDPLLRLHGFMTSHHRDWARTYAEVLMADIAHRSQSSDPRPRRAQREPDGNGVRPGVGQSSGPRPVVPAAPGTRPGAGPDVASSREGVSAVGDKRRGFDWS